MYKLIVTDLDNTLLDREGKLPKRTRELCRDLYKKGIQLSPATGRSPASARAIAKQVYSRAPMICYNGAEIRRADGSLLYGSYLSRKLQEELVDYALKNKLYLQAYDGEKIVVGKLDFKAHPDPDLKYASYRETGDMKKLAQIQSPKLLLAADPKNIPAIQKDLEEKFEDRAYFAQSDAHLIEVMNKGVNKGRSLRILAESMGLAKEEILALGDHSNDIPLIAEAGLGVAVGNAVDALKSRADYVCKKDRSDGFNEALEKFVFGNR